MAKELCIKTIKEEIIEKLMNNMGVLDYFKNYINDGIKISQLRNILIFDHDTSYNLGSYISVEVAEYENPRATIAKNRSYSVAIKMSHEDEENICGMSEVISGIVTSLYPNRRKYSNVPFKTTEYSHTKGKYQKLHRAISFIIE